VTAPDKPAIAGYEIEPLGGGWIARPITGGQALLGNDQDELNAAHHRILSAGLSRLRGSNPPDGSGSPP
jgi:hypothetical protein